MRYILITIISCVISFILEKLYLYFVSKHTTGEAEKTYYPSIWIVAIIVFVSILILASNVLTVTQNPILEICISSGMHLIILMIVSNFCIYSLVKKQYENNQEAIKNIENCIVVLYSIAIIVMGSLSWWYLSEAHFFWMYIAIFFGKFVWFDMKKTSETISGIKEVFVKGGRELIAKHKIMLIFECAIYGLIGMGLYYMKNSERTISPIWDLNAVCLGIALSGALLIYFAILQDQRE